MMSVNSLSTKLLKQDWLFFCEPLKKFQDERLGRIAEELAGQLKDQPRMEIRPAQKNILVLATRKFLRDIKSEDPRIKECKKQLLALKLGMNSDALDANPSFEKFASRNYLERYLMEYNHKLNVDPNTKKISLMVDGQHKPWEDSMAKSAVPANDLPKQPWIYGANGIQNKDMYDWTELKPFKKGNPAEWGHRYIFEFCAFCTGSPQKTGDHSWFRLKTPTGDIYSVGLYRPGKPGIFDNLQSPLRLKPGYLMQPDVSEFWPGKIETISIEIKEDHFHEMKRVIEHDKKRDKEVFQTFQSNCVLYTKKIARIAGIEIPTSIPVSRLLTPKQFEPIFDVLSDALPYLISKIASVVAAIFWNCIQMILGAGKIDHQVRKKHGDDIDPHLSSFAHIFHISKSQIHHPNSLGHRTRLKIEKWRKHETERLKLQKTDSNSHEIDKKIEAIQYSIPKIRHDKLM